MKTLSIVLSSPILFVAIILACLPTGQIAEAHVRHHHHRKPPQIAPIEVPPVVPPVQPLDHPTQPVTPPVVTPPLVIQNPPSQPALIPVVNQLTTLQWGAFTGNSQVLGTYKAVFIGDGDSFNGDGYSNYSVPLVVYWESSLTAQQIASGAADSYLRLWASEMAAYPNQIIFAPLDEMNGSWSAYSGNQLEYILAWDRIRSLFTALNVKFAWTPNNDPSNFQGYYPGNSETDLCGIDGFNMGGQNWQSVFVDNNSLSNLQSICAGKPSWILSTGSVDNQSQFISDTVAGAKQYGISGVIYFDAYGNGGNYTAPASTLQAL